MAFAEKRFAPFQRLHKAPEFAVTGIGLPVGDRERLHGVCAGRFETLARHDA